MERHACVFIANLAAESALYQDVVDSIKKVAKLGFELTVEERSLLFLGYKHMINARRVSLNAISSSELECRKGNKGFLEQNKEYREKVELELASICNDAVAVIDELLIPSSTSEESTALYNKMKGDYFRYLAESMTGKERKEAAHQSLKAYQMASTTAEELLSPTNPIRLSTALNLSVLYYEIMNSPKRAFQLASETFIDAVSERDTLKKESCKESTQILQLLRQNLALWECDIGRTERCMNF